ncbi:unnamed protein product [Amoebophrya sp. A120]|nr:unnamed protein product [Amoebophrya sp. A120]|eukprot:GSA120T00006227001.1
MMRVTSPPNANIRNVSSQASQGVDGDERTATTSSRPKFSLLWRNLSYRVHDKQILKQVYGEFKSGEVAAVMGFSGAGKSTLLNLLAGRQAWKHKVNHDTRVFLNDCPVRENHLRASIGFVPQDDGLFPFHTVYESLLFRARLTVEEDINTSDDPLRSSISTAVCSADPGSKEVVPPRHRLRLKEKLCEEHDRSSRDEMGSSICSENEEHITADAMNKDLEGRAALLRKKSASYSTVTGAAPRLGNAQKQDRRNMRKSGSHETKECNGDIEQGLDGSTMEQGHLRSGTNEEALDNDYTEKMHAAPSSVKTDPQEQRVHEVIRRLGLSHAKDTLIGNHLTRGVSGGERKRVAVACELLSNPPVLFLDEPTSGLDAVAALELVRYLKQIARAENRLIVCVIHQPSSYVFSLFDKAILMKYGEILCEGRVANLDPAERSTSDAVSQPDNGQEREAARAGTRQEVVLEESTYDKCEKNSTKVVVDAADERHELKGRTPAISLGAGGRDLEDGDGATSNVDEVGRGVENIRPQVDDTNYLVTDPLAAIGRPVPPCFNAADWLIQQARDMTEDEDREVKAFTRNRFFGSRSAAGESCTQEAQGKGLVPLPDTNLHPSGGLSYLLKKVSSKGSLVSSVLSGVEDDTSAPLLEGGNKMKHHHCTDSTGCTTKMDMRPRSISKYNDDQHRSKRRRYTPFPYQVWMLWQREFVTFYRNRTQTFARFGNLYFMMLLFCALFANIGIDLPESVADAGSLFDEENLSLLPNKIRGELGALTSTLITLNFWTAAFHLQELVVARDWYIREHSAHLYTAPAFLVAKLIQEIFFDVFCISLFYLILYHVLNLHASFFVLFVSGLGTSLASGSVALFCGSLIKTPSVAGILQPMVFVPMLYLAGQVVPVGQIHPAIRWTRYLVPPAYAVDLVATDNFRGLEQLAREYVRDFPQETLVTDTVSHALSIPDRFGLGYGFDILMLSLIFLVFRALAVVGLHFNGRYLS